MAIPCAALMCHAPIVIPEIGGERAKQCARTTHAMSATAARLAAHAPDVLVLISPHTPRRRVGFGIVGDDVLSGDFAQFGHRELRVHARGAPAAAAALRRCAQALGQDSWSPSGAQLDHGALVPLHFVVQAGYRGPVLLLALPYAESNSEVAIGQAIAAAALELDQRWAVLASGDMSHRLCEGAPAGFHPAGARFDAAVRELVAAGALGELAAIDPELRELAAEDVVASCVVAAAAVAFDATGCRVLDYEGPFGVGYLEALLHESAPPTPRRVPGDQHADAQSRPPGALLAIARTAIEAHLHGRAYEPGPLRPPWCDACGVFATLRCAGGELRGCVGHVEPAYRTLADEVASCAVAAATRDSRFPPVQLSELPALRIELSLLGAPEAIADADQLDPARYGVIVAAGARRGVLLPNIDGITSARDQLRIALAKAGLSRDEHVELARFEVLKLREESHGRT